MLFAVFQKIGRGLLLAALLLAPCSCSENLFEEFRVENSFIAGQAVFADFSAPIEAASAKKNFLFLRDESKVDGDLSFFGNTLVFSPKEKIGENHCYKIQVLSGAKDLRGNSLLFDYCNVVNLKKDWTAPQVLEALKNGQGFELRFSKRIDKKSFDSSFSLQPQKDYFARWNDAGDLVSIIFKDAFDVSDFYSIKVQSALSDECGNKMARDFYWSWQKDEASLAPACEFYGTECGQESAKRLLNLFENPDLSKGIEIRFDREIDLNDLLGAIECEPSRAIKASPRCEENKSRCACVLVTFSKAPKWGEEFDLLVRGGIIKSRGEAFSEKRLRISNKAEGLRPPKLEMVGLMAHGRYICASRESNWKNISFDLTAYPADTEREAPICFLYSISQDANEISRLAAMEATSVQTYSCASLVLTGMKSVRQEDFAACADFFGEQGVAEKVAQLSAAGKKLALVKADAVFKNRLQGESPAHGIIEVKVSQKLADDKNNFMEESELLSFNKN